MMLMMLGGGGSGGLRGRGTEAAMLVRPVLLAACRFFVQLARPCVWRAARAARAVWIALPARAARPSLLQAPARRPRNLGGVPRLWA